NSQETSIHNTQVNSQEASIQENKENINLDEEIIDITDDHELILFQN
ncbi:3053_t:CDS:1, partial [Racocetra fulgida]